MFARWNLPKKVLKEGVETIKSFNPKKSKFKKKKNKLQLKLKMYWAVLTSLLKNSKEKNNGLVNSRKNSKRRS